MAPANGVSFDWNMRARSSGQKVIIAGGLDASNVAEAIRIAQPWGVDASSGLNRRRESKITKRCAQFVQSRAGKHIMITSQPDATGHFGPYGGRFVPEVLMAPLEELERAYREARADPAFQAELTDLLTQLRRPSHAALLRHAA